MAVVHVYGCGNLLRHLLAEFYWGTRAPPLCTGRAALVDNFSPQVAQAWGALRNDTCVSCAFNLSAGMWCLPLARIPGTTEPNVRIVAYVRVAFFKGSIT